MKIYLFLILACFICSTAIAGQDNGVTVAGLTANVTVRRDARSIPYIEAANDADLYFAQGYATASDRLFQMDLMRRWARGETAEIFGKIRLEEDKRWRRFGFAPIAERSLVLLPADLRAALESYARGVNAYIATLHEKSLPVEFQILQYRPREWRPTDSIIIGKILSDALSKTWHHDLLRASLQNLPEEKLADLTNQVTPYDVVLFGTDQVTSADGPHVRQEGEPPASAGGRAAQSDSFALLKPVAEMFLPPAYAGGSPLTDLPSAEASNNWVISGKRTADGKPMLANDPHLLPSAPGIWYLTHLSTPTMRVSGVTFPGVPGIVLGHNEHIAWGATNVGPDVQDLYIETFNEQGEYKTPTGWQKPVTRKETINVRLNPIKTVTEPVTLDVTVTRNGPIIHEEHGKRYALKWTAFDPSNREFEAFYRFNRARNWKDFTTALRNYGGAAQNFVYADVKGNIGWQVASKIPIRRKGDGALPYDGATTDGDWIGTIPFNELPHLYNPPSGLIVTANQRIVGTSYKYQQISRDAAPPWRARRLMQVLDVPRKLTADDSRDAQHDSLSIPHLKLAQEIVTRSAASPETLAMLKAWDGRMAADSHTAQRVDLIRICLANRIADDNKPVPGYLIRERILDRAITNNIPHWLPAKFASYDEMIKGCDADLIKTFDEAKIYGPDKRPLWGSTWRSRFPHPLAAAPLIGQMFATPNVPLDGSGVTPNVGSYVSMRQITTPGNWDSTRHVIPLGQSGDPKSPHFRDQFDKWRSGEPAVFPFTMEAVNKTAPIALVLKPREGRASK